jgi:hypothetical protein
MPYGYVPKYIDPERPSDSAQLSPGGTAKRVYSQYSPYQEALWQAFDDAYFAYINGYAEMRQPTPGVKFDQDRFDAWMERILLRWQVEAKRDDKMRAMVRSDYPEALWIYLFERMVAADSLKDKPAAPYSYED